MNCKWIEAVLAVLIIVFASSSWIYATWVVVIAAAGILIHALTCRSCHTGHHMSSSSGRKR